jgi:predicted hydrocarbon binding protein
MDDVMGQHGLRALLDLARLPQYQQAFPPDTLERQFDFAALAALNSALEDAYGARGGRGMALKIGRAAFARGMKEFGVMKGLHDPAFLALPMEKRVNYGLQALALVFNRFTDQQVQIMTEADSYLFRVEVSPFAWGRTADKPVCHALIGVIQECLSFASNGYEFYVRETACRAVGAEACIFRINKTAIGEKATL